MLIQRCYWQVWSFSLNQLCRSENLAVKPCRKWKVGESVYYCYYFLLIFWWCWYFVRISMTFLLNHSSSICSITEKPKDKKQRYKHVTALQSPKTIFKTLQHMIWLSSVFDFRIDWCTKDCVSLTLLNSEAPYLQFHCSLYWLFRTLYVSETILLVSLNMFLWEADS